MTRNVDGEGQPDTSGSGLGARDGYGTGGSPFKPPTRRPVLHRLMPVSEHLPGYRGGTLRRDLLAGLTVAALALPAAMAYAELAGLSPVAGLYALLLPTVAYTLLGSSRQLIVGPEGSIAALTATALAPLAADDPERYASLAALLALLVGACFLVARVIRLGWVADYSSRPGPFFTWIMTLATLIAVILPFLTDAEPATKLTTAALNLASAPPSGR